MGLLFLNAFKGLKYKKVQMIGIILCIVLSTSIYTAMNIALDRMENRYHEYIKEQNVEDFAFVPNIDYATDYTKEEVQELLDTKLKDIPLEQKQLVMKYQMTIGMKDIPNIENLYEAIDYIFNNNGANDQKLESKIAQTQDKYQFDYTKQVTKTATEENMLTLAIPYANDMKIDIPYLIEGAMPQNDNEITVLPKFAEINNITIGSTYQIGDKAYKVVGYAYSPSHIFPLISISRPMFNEKTDNIIFMNQSTFDSFAGVSSSTYVAAFRDHEKMFDFEAIVDMFEGESNIKLSPFAALNILRVNTLEAEIKTDRLFAQYFLYLLLAISIFVIIVITKKRIEDERLQIGVLKSLGYRSFGIAISYLVYPIIGSLLGGLIGFGIGVPLHEVLSKLYVSYFNLPISGFTFNYTYLLQSILVPMILLSALAFIIAIWMLRKKPLQLLKEGSNLKVNLLSRFVTFVTRKLPFKTRFKLSLASRSLGKLLIVTLTAFCTGMLIVLILIGMNMFTSMIDKTFAGLNYDNMVSYQAARTDTSDTDDLVYSASMTFEKVKRKDGTVELVSELRKESKDKLTIAENKNDSEDKDEKTESISATVAGVDDTTHYIEIHDKEGKDIHPEIKEKNDIIINKNMAEIAKVEVGDTIILKDADTEYEWHVVGIQDSFMGLQAYVKRSEISQLLEGKLAYNTRYTCDAKYSSMSNIAKDEADSITSIFNIADLKANMGSQLESSSGSIYFVIGFASVLALVIILVIANIIVEENKKTISLMKVMGYKNKIISQIVLNIYTPFVIISYIAAIPAMKALLEFIVKQLTSDMEMAIPIEFSFVKALIGLVGLLIAYYVAIFISRRTLNKVPLSVALKRE